MTQLRAKYQRDMAVRGLAERTQQSYTAYVADLARYHKRSPDLISYDGVVDWIHHLIRDRLLAPSSVNIAVNGVRFLYAVTLQRDVAPLLAGVPRMKRNVTRAEVYATSELEAILTAPTQPRDRAFLMTVYACGLRLSEAIALKITDIDRPRMQLRVRHGKGAKERVLPMSPRLLQELHQYWLAQRAKRPGYDCPWLFLGTKPNQPINKATGQNIYYRAVQKSGVRRKGGIHVLRQYAESRIMPS
jgi:site-specific recombinase XerD